MVEDEDQSRRTGEQGRRTVIETERRVSLGEVWEYERRGADEDNCYISSRKKRGWKDQVKMECLLFHCGKPDDETVTSSSPQIFAGNDCALHLDRVIHYLVVPGTLCKPHFLSLI